MLEHHTQDNTEANTSTQISSRYPEPEHSFGFSSFCGHDGPQRPPLVFSHLEHTSLAEGPGEAGCVPVPFQGGLEPSHHQCLSCSSRRMSEEGRREGGGCYEHDSHQLLTQLQSLTVSPNEEGAIVGRISDTEATPQFGAHSVHTDSSLEEGGACGGHAQWAWSRGCHGNCREEALGVGYVDDVTVDDLAGYFDQMLHLPRPMSDMAQLMYT